ncbi:hypothetical protein [Azospirillum halopraeferens]|nr:hypothetical protein [Azospirillum halopraeferens]
MKTSLKKDWKRWSRVERVVAVMLLFAASAALGGPVTLALL